MTQVVDYIEYSLLRSKPIYITYDVSDIMNSISANDCHVIKTLSVEFIPTDIYTAIYHKSKFALIYSIKLSRDYTYFPVKFAGIDTDSNMVLEYDVPSDKLHLFESTVGPCLHDIGFLKYKVVLNNIDKISIIPGKGLIIGVKYTQDNKTESVERKKPLIIKRSTAIIKRSSFKSFSNMFGSASLPGLTLDGV